MNARWLCALLFRLAVPMALVGPTVAEVRLPKIFSDHAVLQRDVPIRVWGWAEPSAAIAVDFHGQHIATTANRLGEWVAWLMPERAGGPYSLSVASSHGEPATTIHDILMGDVWLAAGQSNMEMPLLGFPPSATVKDSAAEIAAANHPNVRLLLVPENGSPYPLDDEPSSWTLCTPETAARFSAVAYFFGRSLSETEHVPIGLIDATWGGTPADAWISMDTFGSDPALIPAFASRADFARNLVRSDAILAADKRDDAAAAAAGRPMPQHMWHPSQTSWMPASIYNGMVAPLTPYSIKGFVWYQGETNSSPDRAPHYRRLFQALITDWRSRFAQGDLPFVYAQISSFTSPGEDWGMVRDAQRRALSLRNTAMAVTLDVGEAGNVHPPDKQTVASRLALAARAIAYHEDISYASPLFREVTSEPGALRVWFDNSQGLSAGAGRLTDFELAGDDHRFLPAEAQLDGQTVVVKSAAVSQPVFVRYGWNGVVQGYIINNAKLPASTFTSEEDPRR